MESVQNLRTDEGFLEVLDDSKRDDTLVERPAKRRLRQSSLLSPFVVEESTGSTDRSSENLKRLYFAVIDNCINEMKKRFSERNSQLTASMRALDPRSETFLDHDLVRPLMELVKHPINEAEFVVAKQYIMKLKEKLSDDEHLTLASILLEHYDILKAMPSVLLAMKLSLTFGSSTAICENSFSTLKNVFTSSRRSMHHTRKCQLVQLAFEQDLTAKLKDEWKERVFRKFHNESRRMQLF